MKITILCVGKKHSDLYRSAIEEFEKRLKRYVVLRWEYVPASNIAQESATIQSRIKNQKVWLLDERGEQVNTIWLSQALEGLQNDSSKKLLIVIGGAYGVSNQLFQRADKVLSISALTFPHQLVRLIVVEQVYRAYDVLAGGKYHHE